MACCVAGTRTLKLLLTSRFTAALFAERRLYHSGPVVFPKTLLLSTGTELHQNPFTRRITNLTHGDRYRKGGIGTPNYDVITEPGNVSPMQYVPDSIARPSYAISGIVVGVPKEVEIKTEEQIARMREACKLARMILSRVSKQVKAGVTTDELDRYAHKLCIENNAYPSPLNYRWFPKSVCTSVNNVACHGIPDDRPLRDGDIISIDVSVFYNGYHGDCAETVMVGHSVDDRGKALVLTTRECLERAISVCGPGQKLSAIGRVISIVASQAGFTVVPAFCGHGIGTYFHGPPDIYHFDNDEKGEMMEGLVFTIEPVITEGSPDIAIMEDGWTTVTVDNSRTAQFEHTVYICNEGAEILTVL
ncbi:methionine aminopeptidase 1D, mitochondrial [Amblyomma americanum]|uniref:Methionine aminopeptidase n=1 Tax=Amblyomma americanum TaxID=6943 RepID=A0AAQ4DV81_AMBAM